MTLVFVLASMKHDLFIKKIEVDDWPQLRQRILDADIFILGSPVWLGHHSSVCQRVLERLDAFLDETDDQGRLVSYGCVAGVVAVGE